METKYIPELEIRRRVCEECGDSMFEFSGVREQKPYLCNECKP